MSKVEYGAGDRSRSGDFPREWGRPPGDPYSEERAAWVAVNVRNWMKAREVARAHQEAVAGANRVRLRLLELMREPAWYADLDSG